MKRGIALLAAVCMLIVICSGCLGKSDEELQAYIEDMLRQREPFYMKAQHIFDVNLLNSTERVAESVRLLREAVGI